VSSDDDEDRKEQRALLARTVRENCWICHSDELIRAQRLTPKQWQAEVEKMVTWGAPLPAELKDPLIAYLSAEFPVAGSPFKPQLRTLEELTKDDRPAASNPANPGDPPRGATLYTSNCAQCHGPEGQGSDLGPTLVEKPVLVADGRFREVVQSGLGRMPGFSSLLDGNAESHILAWLKTQRYVPVMPAK
jgi:ubiquinol-cytochrome c reductase cytochrome c subunit